MAHAEQDRDHGVPRWVVLVALALGFALAGALIIVGVRRSARGGSNRSAAPVSSADPSPGIGGNEGVTDTSRSTTPSISPADAGDVQAPGAPKSQISGYPPGMRAPSTPDTTPPGGTPPVSISGIYRIRFELRADTCASGAIPSTHDIEISVDGSNVIVKDHLSGNTLTGPGGSDGRFVVSVSKDDKFFHSRELMIGIADGSSVSGNFFVYPRADGCVVEYEFSGGRR